jgi:hypothetical protein
MGKRKWKKQAKSIWKRIRTRSIRWTIALAVVVIGVVAIVTVECLQQHEAAAPSEPTVDCTPGEYPSTSVTVRAAVEVGDIDYPRISSDVVIRAPRTWSRANDLLGDPEHSAYRAALRCLFGNDQTDFSVYRTGPPTVTVSGGEVVVHDHVWTELVKPGHGPVGVLDLTIEPDQPWRISVMSRHGLSRSTAWNVTIAAPQHWLESAVPHPWPPYAAKPGELTWLYGITSPTADCAMLAAAQLTPDIRASTYAWEGSTGGDLFLNSADALSASAFLIVILIFIRRIQKRMPPDAEYLVGRARWVTVALLALQFLGLCIEITRVILNAQGERVPDWSTAAWAVDIAVGVTILAIAHCYGVRRKPQLAALRVIAVALLIGWLLREPVAFTNTLQTNYAQDLRIAESTVVFVVTLSVVAALIHAVRAITRSNGKRSERAWWIWPVAAFAAAGLLLERIATTLRNDSLQRWIFDPSPLTDTSRTAFRFTLWSLPAAWLWILALVPAIAVYVMSRSYLQHKVTPRRRTLLMISLTLLVVGPAQWSLTIYGFDLPLWLLVATAFWLFCRVGKPVLDRELRSDGKIHAHMTQREVAAVRRSAKQWLNQKSDSSKTPRHPVFPGRVTPVDVVLAVGPGDSPGENMRIIVKLSLWLGVPFGLAVYLFREITRADLTSALPDSVVLGYFSDVAWEAVKWVFAAAALGVFWQHLPGKRGPIKVLPLVLAYFVGSACVFVTSTLTGGSFVTDGLIDAAVFGIVLVFLGFAMDIRTLQGLDTTGDLTLNEGIAAYGVSNVPTRITAALVPVSAVITIVFTIIAGPQSDSKPGVQSQSPDTSQNRPSAPVK